MGSKTAARPSSRSPPSLRSGQRGLGRGLCRRRVSMILAAMIVGCVGMVLLVGPVSLDAGILEGAEREALALTRHRLLLSRPHSAPVESAGAARGEAKSSPVQVTTEEKAVGTLEVGTREGSSVRQGAALQGSIGRNKGSVGKVSIEVKEETNEGHAGAGKRSTLAVETGTGILSSHGEKNQEQSESAGETSGFEEVGEPFSKPKRADQSVATVLSRYVGGESQVKLRAGGANDDDLANILQDIDYREQHGVQETGHDAPAGEAARGAPGSDTMGQLPISHSMDDEELLWRASFVSLRDPSRRSGPKKIAFLFSFSRHLYFAPLWAKFLQGHEGKFSVYLHGSEAGTNTSRLPDVFRNRFVPFESHPENGDPFPHMYAVDAARRLVANALLDMGNEWFVFVCELCAPIRSFRYFYEFFSGSPTRNFVPHQTPPVKGGQDRFLANCFAPVLYPEQWRKGSPWLGITRRLALSLVSDIKYYDKFASCCLPVKRGGIEPCLPVEHYMSTTLPVLGAYGTTYLESEEVTNWSLIFEDWWTDSWAGRPFIFNTTTLSTKLIRNMQRCHLGNLCHLMGAHFAPATLRLFMNMSDILGY